MATTTFIPEGWEESTNIIKVIGVGGGGTNAVSYMYNQGMDYVDFAVCNTDKQHLSSSPVPYKLELGKVLTKGLGAGTEPDKGRRSALESLDEINSMLSGDTEMVFITCGMGGGTGTGAAPVIAEAAKAKGLLTVAVVTIPFRDEGPEALSRASAGIQAIKNHVDSLLIIDNQKLYEVYPDLDVFTLFSTADDVLATAVRSITEIISRKGVINVDFADVCKVMRDSGMALMGRGVADGEERTRDAVEAAFTSPLLNDFDIDTANRALVNISCSSEHALSSIEFSTIMELINSYTGSLSTFKRGITRDESLGKAISVTVIATGFEANDITIMGGGVPKDNEIPFDPSDESPHSTGLPIAVGAINITKRERVMGKPSLVVDSLEEIRSRRLDDEPAYLRRDRVLYKNKQI